MRTYLMRVRVHDVTEPTRHDCPSCRYVPDVGSLRSPHRLRAQSALRHPADAPPRRVLSALRAPNPTTLGDCMARSEKTYLERGPELTFSGTRLVLHGL